MFTNLQKGFGGGEIAPELWGKTDHPKYPIALKKCENFKVTRAGNLTKCPGTELVARTPNDLPVRLFKFVIDDEEGYLLEFSDSLVRFYQDGKIVAPSGSEWNILEDATYSPGSVVTYSGNTYIAIYNQNNDNSNKEPDTHTDYWYQITGTTYELQTNYAQDDLSALKFGQVNGVLYIVHPSYAPMELVFDKDVPGFYFKKVMTIPSIKSDYLQAHVDGYEAGLYEYDYKVTVERLSDGEESFPIPLRYATPKNAIQRLKRDTGGVVPGQLYIITRFSLTFDNITTSEFSGPASLSALQTIIDDAVGIGRILVSQTPYDSETVGPLWMTQWFDQNVGDHAIYFEYVGDWADQSFTLFSFNPIECYNSAGERLGNGLFIAEQTQAGSSGNLNISNIVFDTTNKYIEITTLENSHGSSAEILDNGSQILITGTKIELIDDRVFNVYINGLADNVFKIFTDPSGYGTIPSTISGKIAPTEIKSKNVAAPTGEKPITITLDINRYSIENTYPFQIEYNIYKSVGGVYGFIGSTQGYTFKDTGMTADTTYCPPTYNPVFVTKDDYPSCVESYQQRLCLCATNKKLLGFNASRTGYLENFTTRTNLQSDDAIIHQDLEADAGAKIKHLVNFGFLIVFTDQGEIVLKGDSTGTLTTTNINCTPQTYNGCSDLRPLKINKSVLYSQAQTSLVRDMQVQITPYGYTYIASSEEITLFSKHLVEGYSIKDWDYQRIYDGTVWCARNDGVALGLTYCPEQQLAAWWRRTTQGTFENFCAVIEGIEDAVYAVVKRTIGGTDYRFIERMSSDQWFDVKDSNFLDCSVSYDGRNTSDKTMMLVPPTIGKLWTLNCSENYFPSDTSGGLYQHIKWFIRGADGYLVKCTPVSYIDPKNMTVEVDRFVPDGTNSGSTDNAIYGNMINLATTDWSLAQDIIECSAPIYGATGIAATIDANVVCNPMNLNISDTVSFITMDSNTYAKLPDFGEVIRVGFPYMSSIETLDYDEPKDSYINKKTILKQCSLMLKSSQSFWVGSQDPGDNLSSPQNMPGSNHATDNVFGLTEAKIRDQAGYDSTVDLVTGRVLVNFAGTFTYGAAGFVRSLDPLPLTISALGFTIDAKEMGK
jgi:hypothetical protein